MSTLTITFQTQALDSPPYIDNGIISVDFDYGSGPVQLRLIETTNPGDPSTQYYFTLEPWIDGASEEDDNQAINFRNAWNRDYAFVGGVPIGGGLISKNLAASVVDNVVTITAIIGTFSNYNYSGDKLGQASGVINNTPQVTPLSMTLVQDPVTGDCDNIQYLATASGGQAPYVLNDGAGDIVTGWDGSLTSFNLLRTSFARKVQVTDSASNVVHEEVLVPRALQPGDFSITSLNFETYSDITVVRDIVIAGTAPLEYSLTVHTATAPGTYQSSNVFTGVLKGQYKVWIRDVYQCETTKIINVTGFQDVTESEQIRYFEIVEGQSIIFSEFPTYGPQVKKNYFNSRSQNTNKFTNYACKHYFDPSDNYQGIQFKSSYDYHIITLHGCDGSMQDITSTLIQENLGATEKMDCVLFPINGKTGVYFNGGNWYIPDTDTIDTANPDPVPDGTTPRWAVVGQLVFLDGLGGFYIESVSYDNVRGGYFVLDFVTASEGASKIQVTYNVQNYNLFEAYINVNTIPDGGGFIVFEKGFNGDNVDGNPWVGELIYLKEDSEDDLLLQWADDKNKGGIVYQSGISFMARLEGEFDASWDNVSETESGDNQEYNIEQKSFLEFQVYFEMLTTKQVTQLNHASALENFRVNGLLLQRKEVPEIEKRGKSNLYGWRCKFGYGENLVAIRQDEIVLSPSTGVPGGGSSGKNPIPDLSPITLFKLSNGDIITSGGKLIKTT